MGKYINYERIQKAVSKEELKELLKHTSELIGLTMFNNIKFLLSFPLLKNSVNIIHIYPMLNSIIH